MRKTIRGGIAVTATLGAMLASGAYAGGPNAAGKPQPDQRTLCGAGNAPQVAPDGTSSESKFGGAGFTASETKGLSECTGDETASTTDTWTIGHGNVNTTDGSERGTEHGQYTLTGSPRSGGFNGHVTDFDFGSAPCHESDTNRVVYYESGTENDAAHGCPPDFGPVGNFNTHGGAQTGDHFRGTYGTLIFQTDGDPNSKCDDHQQAVYCIQVQLDGQTN